MTFDEILEELNKLPVSVDELPSNPTLVTVLVQLVQRLKTLTNLLSQKIEDRDIIAELAKGELQVLSILARFGAARVYHHGPFLFIMNSQDQTVLNKHVNKEGGKHLLAEGLVELDEELSPLYDGKVYRISQKGLRVIMRSRR